MSRVIQARLDETTEKLCDKLQQQLGWSDSQVVREGIKSLSTLIRTGKTRKIIGQGRCESGIGDLASNKKHLKGFGK